MPESEDRDFERVVAGFLAEGLHTRRGLTAEEYTAVCRRALVDPYTFSGGGLPGGVSRPPLKPCMRISRTRRSGWLLGTQHYAVFGYWTVPRKR
jgi:hypothetical protein